MTGARAVPFFCPYCGDEEIRPHGEEPGSWRCASCTRVFTLRFLGLHRAEALPADP